MDDVHSTPNPLRMFIWEVSLVLVVFLLLGLFALMAFQAVDTEVTFERARGGELLRSCQQQYRLEVYNEETEHIDDQELADFYNGYPDCKLFNVTDLDPFFEKGIFDTLSD
ncbi:MAG: hypothetical protein ACE5DX_01365 [Candidatus Dojkabacteria bacterium]